MSLLILVVFSTLFVSALCSLFEATLYSTRMGTLEAARGDPKKGDLASRFIIMKRHIDVPIAAILILNTVANTAGATLSGMYASKILGTSKVVLFSIALTLSILVLSEILPKTLGAVYWQRLWSLILWPLIVLERLLYPAIWITQQLTRLLTKGHVGSPITGEEIMAAARLGEQAGEISPQESRLVHNVINLETKQVRQVMTPRTVIFSLEADLTVEEALPLVSEAGLTRVPIYEQHREHIMGYVTLQDLAGTLTSHQLGVPLRSLVKPLTFISEAANCLSLLTTFLQHRRHIAIVADEYGGVAGLVTLEDLLETLLGAEIVDEADRTVDLQKMARQRHQQRPTPPDDASREPLE